ANEVVVEFFEQCCIDCCGSTDHEERIAVCRRTHDRLYTDIATTARTVLDDELLTEALRQPLTNEARSNVVNTTGRKWDNDAHRPRRIGLRPRNPRRHRQRGSAGSQIQKISAGKFHFEPPFTSLDHLVGEREQPVRNLEAEGLGSLEVDYQLIFRRPLHVSGTDREP